MEVLIYLLLGSLLTFVCYLVAGGMMWVIDRGHVVPLMIVMVVLTVLMFSVGFYLLFNS